MRAIQPWLAMILYLRTGLAEVRLIIYYSVFIHREKTGVQCCQWMMSSNRFKRCSTPHLFHDVLRGLVASDFVLHSMVPGSIPVPVLTCIFVFILPMYFTD